MQQPVLPAGPVADQELLDVLDLVLQLRFVLLKIKRLVALGSPDKKGLAEIKLVLEILSCHGSFTSDNRPASVRKFSGKCPRSSARETGAD